MVRVETNGRNYGAAWTYGKRRDRLHDRDVRWTECAILLFAADGTHEEIGYGTARVHHKDQFCRQMGRKTSLSKALACASLPKDVRTAFWQAYDEQIGLIGRPARLFLEIPPESIKEGILDAIAEGDEDEIEALGLGEGGAVLKALAKLRAAV
jgi:hypothetical protein